MRRVRKCGALTQRGGRCQNYYDTCPIAGHRASSASEVAAKEAVGAAAREAARNSEPSIVRKVPLIERRDLFDDMVIRSADIYGIEPKLIIRDYWLISTLCAWQRAVGSGYVQRAYPNPALSDADNRVGRCVFGGGTSLSAAWGITQRWSEDVDLTLSMSDRATTKHFKQACLQAFTATAQSISATHNVTDQGSTHCFASFLRDRQAVARIDVTSRPLDADPVWTQHETVMSMIGRVCGDEMLEAHPELGGFEVDTLGPGTTAMDKLLAQTRASMSGDLKRINERARDLYDLACVARDKDRFEGHIGRDSKALLYFSENWLPQGDPKRPPEGFASLRSFDPATHEYEALASGYDDVINRMVWGEKIPLDEAVRLAVSLDPGPSEPHRPPDPNPLVAYPRH